MNKHFSEMTLPELEQERAYWESKIANAPAWGASVGVADGFRRQCIAWIARRRLGNALASGER